MVAILATKQEVPGWHPGQSIYYLQQITLVHDEGVEHAEGLLRGEFVPLEPQQPARHALEPLQLAARLLGQLLLGAPLVVGRVRPAAALADQQLFHDLEVKEDNITIPNTLLYSREL